MNEFSQISLRGQGLLLLEQDIVRLCSIGEQGFSSSFHNTLSVALLDLCSPASLLSWSAHLVRCRPHFPSAFSGVPHAELVCPSVVVHPRDVAALFPFKSLCSVGSVSHAVLLLKSSHCTRSHSVTWVILCSIFR
jgi:hypothetical protein